MLQAWSLPRRRPRTLTAACMCLPAWVPAALQRDVPRPRAGAQPVALWRGCRDLELQAEFLMLEEMELWDMEVHEVRPQLCMQVPPGWMG